MRGKLISIQNLRSKIEALAPIVLCVASLVLVTLRYENWPLQILRGGYDSDFASLWFAGHAVLDGTPVYDVAALTELAKGWNANARYIPFVYPPFVLFLAVPCALLPMWLAFPLWNAVSLSLFCVAARSYGRGWILVTPATLICLLFGQYGLMIGALWLWAWRLRPWAVVLLTAKPHVGFLAGFPFLREPRRLVAPALIATSLFAASVAAFGIDVWPAFFHQAFGSYAEFVRKGGFPVMVLQAVTPMIGYGIPGALLYGFAAVVMVWRRLDVFTAATATFLISPYGFHYDLTVVCLGFGLLLARRQLQWFEQLICLLAFFSPLIVGYGTWLVPPILLLGLWVQCRNPGVD